MRHEKYPICLFYLDNQSEPSTPPASGGVVMRKKSASKPSSTNFRPLTVDASMKMWETPAWKRDLMEKKKKRESLGPIKIETEVCLFDYKFSYL